MKNKMFFKFSVRELWSRFFLEGAGAGGGKKIYREP